MHAKKTPNPDDSTQVKLWIRDELLKFVDEIALRDERSRGYVINQALTAWRNNIVANRERRRRIRGGG